MHAGTFLKGVLEKVGVEPQVKRIGKYKSAGDQLLRKDMSDPQREQLTALLEDIYEGFAAQIAKDRNKTPEEVCPDWATYHKFHSKLHTPAVCHLTWYYDRIAMIACLHFATYSTPIGLG